MPTPVENTRVRPHADPPELGLAGAGVPAVIDLRDGARRPVDRALSPVAVAESVRPGHEPVRPGHEPIAGRELRRPLVVFLLSRLTVLAAVTVAVTQHAVTLPARSRVPWPTMPSSGRLLDAFSAWDAGWYLRIASQGYSPNLAHRVTWDIAFFPFFPMLVRAAAATLHISPLAAGVVVSLVLGAGATVAVWYATVQLAGRDVADRTVLLWCFFPGAFVLSLVYSEGLTVICAAACLIALLRRRWLLAGLAAAAAGATQPGALVLVVCCAWAAAEAIRHRREWAALVAPVLAPVGASAYFAYLWVRSGHPAAWFDSERVYWANHRLGPYWTVIWPLRVFKHDPLAIDNAIKVIGLGLAGLGLYLLWRWRPPTIVSIWGAGVIGMAIMSAAVGTRPRFFLVAFPLVIAVARVLPRRLVYATAITEAVLLALLTFMTVATLAVVP